MNHPPIPPNCAYFTDDELMGKGFILPLPNLDVGVGLTDFDSAGHLPAWRHIIAAVARCAWLDEAERTAHLSDLQAKKATRNADAWRKWGR